MKESSQLERDDKWFSTNRNGLVLLTVGLRRNRQKYKKEIGKSSLK